MKEYVLGLNGLHCNACEKIIDRGAAQNNASVKDIDERSGFVTITCEESTIGKLKKELELKGFTERRGEVKGPRGDFGRVKDYLFSILSAAPETYVESRLLNYSLASFVLLMLAGIMISFFAAGAIQNFASYVPFFFLSIVFSIIVVFSYNHMLAYKETISCTVGMMVGMTVGMIIGFMSGALIGVTNGMFAGSIVGILLGIGTGVSIGRHCGVMGAMEGIMAGFMAGIMGAMTSVMLISDNLVAFLYIAFVICAIVLFGLSYMMFRETGSAANDALKTGLLKFLATAALFNVFMILIMVFGPKSALAYL